LRTGIVACVQSSHQFGALTTLRRGIKIEAFLGETRGQNEGSEATFIISVEQRVCPDVIKILSKKFAFSVTRAGCHEKNRSSAKRVHRGYSLFSRFDRLVGR
jgi:hypothetical protein